MELKELFDNPLVNQDKMISRIIEFDLASEKDNADFIYFDKMDTERFGKLYDAVVEYCNRTLGLFCKLYGIRLQNFVCEHLESGHGLPYMQFVFKRVEDSILVKDEKDNFREFTEGFIERSFNHKCLCEAMVKMLVDEMVDSSTVEDVFCDVVILCCINAWDKLPELLPHMFEAGVCGFTDIEEIPEKLIDRYMETLGDNAKEKMVKFSVYSHLIEDAAMMVNVVYDVSELSVTFLLKFNKDKDGDNDDDEEDCDGKDGCDCDGDGECSCGGKCKCKDSNVKDE